MSEIKNINWNYPTPIWFGLNRSLEIASALKNLNITKPLVVTDPQFSENESFKKIMRNLSDASIQFSIFTNLKGNPTGQNVSDGVKVFNNDLNDGVIAIGGVSALDAGKAIAFMIGQTLSLWDFEDVGDNWTKADPNKIAPIIAVPTTAGTGAETESTAMVTDVEQMMKFCICHPELKPSVAILDPELTLKLPANLTAWTGVDAMVHAIEGYIVPGFHPLCDGAALESLNLISKSLHLAVEEPDNLAARGAMLVASMLGGVAFIKGLGLVHAIAHMVGAEYNTHHGLTNAIILPTVLRYNLPTLEEKVKRMSEAMQYEDSSVATFITNQEKLLDRFNIPKGLKEIGIPEDCVDRIAEKSMVDTAFGTNPIKADLDDVRKLVIESINKAR